MTKILAQFQFVTGITYFKVFLISFSNLSQSWSRIKGSVVYISPPPYWLNEFFQNKLPKLMDVWMPKTRRCDSLGSSLSLFLFIILCSSSKLLFMCHCSKQVPLHSFLIFYFFLPPFTSKFPCFYCYYFITAAFNHYPTIHQPSTNPNQNPKSFNPSHPIYVSEYL